MLSPGMAPAWASSVFKQASQIPWRLGLGTGRVEGGRERERKEKGFSLFYPEPWSKQITHRYYANDLLCVSYPR